MVKMWGQSRLVTRPLPAPWWPAIAIPPSPDQPLVRRVLGLARPLVPSSWPGVLCTPSGARAQQSAMMALSAPRLATVLLLRQGLACRAWTAQLTPCVSPLGHATIPRVLRLRRARQSRNGALLGHLVCARVPSSPSVLLRSPMTSTTSPCPRYKKARLPCARATPKIFATRHSRHPSSSSPWLPRSSTTTVNQPHAELHLRPMKLLTPPAPSALSLPRRRQRRSRLEPLPLSPPHLRPSPDRAKSANRTVVSSTSLPASVPLLSRRSLAGILPAVGCAAAGDLFEFPQT